VSTSAKAKGLEALKNKASQKVGQNCPAFQWLNTLAGVPLHGVIIGSQKQRISEAAFP